MTHQSDTFKLLSSTLMKSGARGSVEIKALCYKPGGRGFDSRRGKCFTSICLILAAPLGPGVYSVSNTNEYQKEEGRFGEQTAARPVREAENLTAICEPLV
jgi:hypothetical protein